MASTEAALGSDPTPEISISAIVSRIQERAIQVVDEKDSAEEAQAICDKLETERDGLLLSRHATHQRFLRATQHHATVALSCGRLQGRLRDRSTAAASLAKQASQAEERLRESRASWDATTALRLAAHDVRCRLYADHLRSRVKQRKDSIEQREKRLEMAVRLTQARSRDARAMQAEQRDLQRHLEDLISRHNQSNKYIQDLARELRETLARRTKARDLLREVEIEHQNGN